jgi:hypothetical protein
MDPKTSMDLSAIRNALDSIANSLQNLVQPTRAGKPSGDSLHKTLARIADALEAQAKK